MGKVLGCGGIASAAGVPVAVFPFQELGESRNEVNLPLTISLGEALEDNGAEIVDIDSVISFMANHRIRTVGQLETLVFPRVQRELGAPFVLLGTVSEHKERPVPSVGLTLNLVRTSDALTVWSYVGALSTADERRMLAVGEPESVVDLQNILIDEIVELWPFQEINEVRLGSSINIELASIEPRYAQPGEEIFGQVQLRDFWVGANPPQVFFKVGDQLYPAKDTGSGNSYEGTWLAADINGKYEVHLQVEYPEYERLETALLGSYVVDGTPPIFELNFPEAKVHNGRPVFNKELLIIPRMVVRKPLSRWRLAFFQDQELLGDMTGQGNLPDSFLWSGQKSRGDGIYIVQVETWDQAGNKAQVTKEIELSRSLPNIKVAVDRNGSDAVLDLQYQGKIPLKYWRLEMWTEEGKILTQSEGEELPVEIGVELPEVDKDQKLEGFLFFQDELGNQIRRKVNDLLPKPNEKEAVKEKPTEFSESWVDEF